MSRLLEILEEQQSLNERAVLQSVIDGKAFKKYTDVGNLFRLMLVTSNDQPFPVVGKQNLVSLMLDDTIKDNSKGVKALQAAFNKLKKTFKDGKKPTVAMKKAYFGVLFSLLVPMTASANFKVGALTNNFASNSKNAQSFQRKATVLIGRTLLKSEIADLNAKDEQAIKGYIMGLSELDDVETTTLNNPEVANAENDEITAPEETQPKSQIDTLINSETSDEKLDEIIAQTEESVKSVENDKLSHEERANAIKITLSENQTSDIFKVTDAGIDEVTTARINEKLDVLFNDVKKTMSVKEANFVTKFVKDTIDSLNSVKGYINFNSESLSFGFTPNLSGNGFDISMKAGNPMHGDEELFFMDRTIEMQKDGLVVKNKQLQIPNSLQGTSINKDIFSNALDLYKARGVSKVKLEANVDVGGYAWFRYGFVPEDNKQIKSIGKWIRDVLPVVYNGLQYDAYDIGEYVRTKSYDKSQDLLNLTDLLKQGQSPLAQEVLKKLSLACAKEFENTYKTNDNFKTMQTDLAIKNFKSITHKGTKYTISYKALLSIQALKDDSDYAIVPMTNGVYLNWFGELDMNDLDDTYAYLNGKKS